MSRPDNASLKQSLRRRFPATAWRVNSGRGTSSNWTHVVWSDGPSTDLVQGFLATIGARPGYMDQTDYYCGERVTCNRAISDGFKLRVATELLSPKIVPPTETWHHSVKRSNAGGWYDLRDCIWRAIEHRDDLERARFDAHAWLEAWAHNSQEAPSAVCFA